MLTIVIWAAGAALLLINIMLRTRILRLEARLKEQTGTQAYLDYLRQHAGKGDVAAIKALRKTHPELSMVESKKLWDQLSTKMNNND